MDAFKAFYNWLYTQRLYDPPAQANKVPLRAITLCKVFVIGDARGVPALKNAAMDALISKIGDEWTMFSRCIEFVYENT